jgi:type IV pilus assembly protein PilM
MLSKFAKGKKGLVGLDIGSSRIKAVEVKAKGQGRYELVNLGQVGLMADTIVDGQIIDGNHVSDCINRIFEEQAIKENRIATSISGHAVIVKKITVPAMSNEELREQIHWEAEQHIPFDINDVNLDYHIVDGQIGGNVDVLLVACKKDMVSQLTQVISQAGKMPSVVDVDAFALQNAYEVNYHPQPSQIVMLLNIGASVTNINIVRGGNSVFTRDVSMGGNQYTDALQKKLNLTFDQAELLKRGVVPEGVSITPADAEPLIQSVTEMLAVEVQRTLDFFYNQTLSDGEHVEHMLVAGGSSKASGLLAYLAERFQMPVVPFDPFRNISINSKKFDESYIHEFAPDMAVAVGLALRGVS